MAETLQFSTSHTPTANSIPIVMIHGWGLNSAVWQPFMAQLSDDFKARFHLLTVDLPGFGKNYDHHIAPYTLANIVNIIAQSIEQPAIYLGWSLGGLVATEMALSYPSKVLALITVASSPRFMEEAMLDIKADSTAKSTWLGIKPKVLKSFHQQLHVDTQKTINNFLKIQAMGSPHIRQDIKQISQLVMQYQMPSKATLDASLCLLESSDYRNKIAEIEQPFLRLYGGGDSLVPSAVVAEIGKLAKDSEQYVFSQASHAPFISHLEKFNQVLTDWLFQLKILRQ